MDPLLALRSLTANVEHPVGKFANDEGGLRYASSLHTGAEHVLVIGEVVWCCDSVDGVEVATANSKVSMPQE